MADQPRYSNHHRTHAEQRPLLSTNEFSNGTVSLEVGTEQQPSNTSNNTNHCDESSPLEDAHSLLKLGATAFNFFESGVAMAAIGVSRSGTYA